MSSHTSAEMHGGASYTFRVLRTFEPEEWINHHFSKASKD